MFPRHTQHTTIKSVAGSSVHTQLPPLLHSPVRARHHTIKSVTGSPVHWPSGRPRTLRATVAAPWHRCFGPPFLSLPAVLWVRVRVRVRVRVGPPFLPLPAVLVQCGPITCLSTGKKSIVYTLLRSHYNPSNTTPQAAAEPAPTPAHALIVPTINHITQQHASHVWLGFNPSNSVNPNSTLECDRTGGSSHPGPVICISSPLSNISRDDQGLQC
jgi:hypothetical protein